MEVIEIDIEELAETVFANEIKQPNSYSISFDNIHIIEVFQSLLYILSQGCKHIYKTSPYKNNISELDAADFVNLERYFRSFGITINLEVVSELPANYVNYDHLTINSHTKLDELRYTMTHNDTIFICSFGVLGDLL